jgi:hypothetical protein
MTGIGGVDLWIIILYLGAMIAIGIVSQKVAARGPGSYFLKS